MKLQYLGHSCFRIISEMGTTVVCDPFKSDYVGFTMPSVRCDVATVSHHHADHDCLDNLLGGYAVVDEPINFPADDIAISAVSTFHDEQKGEKRGKNTVFLFSIDGLRVAHMGDVGCFDEKVASFVKDCDVLLLPVGGVYTVDARGAKKYVEAIHPKIVVPMHFYDKDLKFTLNKLDDFLQLFDNTLVTKLQSDSLTLYDAPQNDVPRITVLERYVD